MNEENFIFGLDNKISRIERYCEQFLKNEDNFQIIKKKLSIFPTFLFFGLPGTGKTTIANEVYRRLKEKYNIDLYRLYMDQLISYNFGESSKNVISFFEKIEEDIKKNNSFAYIIIDELDSFTMNRYQNNNESIKRILLTFNLIIDKISLNNDNKIIIIGTTNMKESIDASILRRFFFHENFDISLDKTGFFKFIKEIQKLSNLFNIFDNKDMLDDLFKIYEKKKFTLGELKTIFAHLYMEKEKLSNLKIFEDKESFYEINSKQGGN